MKDKNRDLENNRFENKGYTDPEHKAYPEDMHLNYGGEDYFKEQMHLSKSVISNADRIQ